MLIHTVLLSLKSEDELPGVLKAMTILEGVLEQVDGMHTLRHGPNRDFEEKSTDYPYGFVVEFADREAHLAYERHPDHIRAGRILIAACTGGAEGIFVSDLEISDA